MYSLKMKAGKRRTYFFDVRKTKGDDYYLTLTESTKKNNGEGYERHKIFLYKEDFNRFLAHFQEAIDYIKTDLMPNYDYDEFNRYYEEEDEFRAEGRQGDAPPRAPRPEQNSPEPPKTSDDPDEHDMSW